MAIDKKQFIEKIETNLQADKKFEKFFINFTQDGKRINRVLNFTTNNWDKRTRIAKAKLELLRLKNKEYNRGINFNENSTLNQIKEIYFEKSRKSTDWTKELKNMYRLYLESSIGKKKIKDIRTVHIDTIRTSMEQKGHSKQTENGCSVRTVKKVLIQTLKPILQYAVDNKVIDSIPIINISKERQSKKKSVKNASEKLAILYKTIFDQYANHPLYRGLFLFALYGRRWNEIKTLKWHDINFKNHTYTIRAENNKINEDQTYDLPIPIKDTLKEIIDDHQGLVFKSPRTSKELSTPKVQLKILKIKANIPELTMHYFRHILVSAMGEMGTANTVLSASLGHVNLQTVNDYYLSANHTKGSQEANITINKLISENEKL